MDVIRVVAVTDLFTQTIANPDRHDALVAPLAEIDARYREDRDNPAARAAWVAERALVVAAWTPASRADGRSSCAA